MTIFKEKLKYAILPHFLVVLAATIIFDVAYYFLFIHTPSSFSKGATNIFIPLCFALLVQLITLLPFINKFSLPPKTSRFSLNFFSLIIICAPLLLSLPLMRLLFSQVITVEKVSDITSSPKGDCFYIKNTATDATRVGESFWTEEKKPKHGKRYTQLKMVLAAPFIDGIAKGHNSIYWYYLEYSRNESSTEIAEGEIEDFKAKCYADFKSVNTLNNMVYAEYIREDWADERVLEAINDVMYNTYINHFIILKPHYKSLTAETLLHALYLLAAFAGGFLLWGIMIWKATLKEQPITNDDTSQNWMSKKG